MALDFQAMPLVFGGGVDAKTDQKSIQAGKLITLENATFKAPGSFTKPIPMAPLGDDPSANPIAGLARFQDEIVALDRASLFARVQSPTPRWANRGEYIPLSTSRKVIVPNAISSIGYADIATDGTLQFVVYSTLSVGSTSQWDLWYRVIDPETKSVIVADTMLEANAQQPRVVIGGGRALITYVAGTTSLKMKWISLSTPGVVEATVTVDASLSSAWAHDAFYALGSFYVANSRASTILVQKYSGGAGSPSESQTVSATVTSGLTALLGGAGSVVVLYNTSTRIAVLAMDAATLSVTQSPLSLINNSGLWTVGAVAVSETQIDFAVTQRASMVDPSIDRTDNRTIIGTINMVAGSWVLSGPPVTVRSVGIVSKPFLYGELSYFPVCHAGDQLNCIYAVLNSAGKCVSKMLVGSAGWADLGGYPSSYSGALTYSVTLPCSIATFNGAILSVNEAMSDSGTIIGTEIDIDFSTPIYSLESGGSLLLSGGFPWEYDGSVVVEHGFHLYPEIVTATTSDTGSAHTYRYVAWYEWTDAQGRIHMSAPTQISSTVKKAHPIDPIYSVAVSVPTLRVTRKHGVRIGLGRTTADGTILYSLNGLIPASMRENDPTVDAWTYTDSWTDTAIQTLATVYTTGGVLANVEPAGISQIVEHRGRVFAIDSEHPERAWYSKLVQPGLPVEFSDALIQTPESDSGELTGMASMDDKLVFFKGAKSFYITGQGPDDTGGQDDYPSPAYRLAGDIGCTDPRTICVSSLGVARMSEKGLYMLNRGMSDSYFGATAERLVDAGVSITGAAAVEAAQQLRFALYGGGFLIYDYLVDQWGVLYPGVTGVSASINGPFGGGIVYASGNKVYVESPDSSYNRFAIESAWIQLAGIQGYQRVRRLLLLGEWLSPHQVSVEVCYDFDPTTVQTAQFDESVAPTSGPYQIRLDLARQLCEAVKFRIVDSQSTAPATGSIDLVSPAPAATITLNGVVITYGTDFVDGDTLAQKINNLGLYDPLLGVTATSGGPFVSVSVPAGFTLTWSAGTGITLTPEATVGGDAGNMEGMTLSAMTLEIGVKRGTRKMAATSKISAGGGG
jgi:hypothetical protein